MSAMVPFFDHYDAVGPPYCRQPMRNHEHRFGGHQKL